MTSIAFTKRNIFLLSLLFAFLLYLKRGTQLIQPEVWVEDGFIIIPSFIYNGWANLIEPVQGYLITIPKLITNISLTISFVYYPYISTILTWIFTVFVALAVVYSPTKIKYPFIAALLVFFVPISPEPFGLPLYTFWIANILLFLVALWDNSKHQIIKNIFLIIAGLSSPVVAVIIPVQIFRIIVFPRKKEEIITLIIAILLFSIQAYYILNDTSNIVPNESINASRYMQLGLIFNNIDTILVKFFAFFYLRTLISFYNVIYPSWLVIVGGLYVIFILIVYWWFNKRDYTFYILIYLLFATIYLSIVRMPIYAIDPIHAGMRYFFMPYILLSWTLLHIASKHRYYIYAILPIFIGYMHASISNFSRTHDPIHWSKYAAMQTQNQNVPIPIHAFGSATHTIDLPLSPKICKKLVEKEFLPMSKEMQMYKKGFLNLKEKKILKRFNTNIDTGSKNIRLVKNSIPKNKIMIGKGITNYLKISGSLSLKNGLKPCSVIILVNKVPQIANITKNRDNYYGFSVIIKNKLLKSGKNSITYLIYDSNCKSYEKALTINIYYVTKDEFLNALPRVKNGFTYDINDFKEDDKKIHIVGWIFENKKVSLRKPIRVFMKINNRYYDLAYGVFRQDVYRHFRKNDNYLTTGFYGTINKSTLKKGRYTVEIFALTQEKNALFPLKEKYTIIVK